MIEPSSEFPSAPMDADQVVLENVRRFVEQQSTGQHVLHISGEETVPSEELVEIAKGAESLTLADAREGDVVWWKTESGTTGYFIVEEPYIKTGEDVSQHKSGKGKFLIGRQPNHPLGDQRGEGNILGATIGGMLKKDTIVKGTNVEYKLRVGEEDKIYRTTPVTDMGIMRTEARSTQSTA